MIMITIAHAPEGIPGEKSRVRNNDFDSREGFNLGRSRLTFIVWYLTKCVFFLSPWPWPSALKSMLIRLFGAKVGEHVCWKPRINVHIPWKLEVGDFTWIGEEVCIYNYAPVTIGSHCCLSQRCFLCAANHDYTARNMCYRNQPIRLEDGVWIGAQTFVGPGVHLGVDCVVLAASVVTRSLPEGLVCGGHPCQPVRRRWKEYRFVAPVMREL